MSEEDENLLIGSGLSFQETYQGFRIFGRPDGPFCVIFDETRHCAKSLKGIRTLIDELTLEQDHPFKP